MTKITKMIRIEMIIPPINKNDKNYMPEKCAVRFIKVFV